VDGAVCACCFFSRQNHIYAIRARFKKLCSDSCYYIARILSRVSHNTQCQHTLRKNLDAHAASAWPLLAATVTFAVAVPAVAAAKARASLQLAKATPRLNGAASQIPTLPVGGCHGSVGRTCNITGGGAELGAAAVVRSIQTAWRLFDGMLRLLPETIQMPLESWHRWVGCTQVLEKGHTW
jgi:hypothetical protein